jgi:tRNA (guanine-N7-)-methyltransferase
MFTPEFLELAWNRMKAAALLVVQTDNKAYWTYLLKAVDKFFAAEVVPGAWPDAPQGRTRREIIARRKGLKVWRMVARRREKPLDLAIPRPDFDANRPRFRSSR